MTNAPDVKASAFLQGLQLLLAAIFTFGALLVLVPAQTTLLWKLEILAREQGHLFALCALAVAAIGLHPANRRTATQRTAVLLSAISAAVMLLPVLRGRMMASEMKSAVAVFGDTTPRSMAGAPALAAPVAPTKLFSRPVLWTSPPAVHRYLAANGDTLSLNLYSGPGGPDRPLVVVIHGGSWRGGTPADLPELGQYLVARGYAVASIAYRFAPKHLYPAARNDVQRALAFLRENAAALQFDASRMVLIGRSAGGHLALLAAYADAAPDIRGVVALYPVTDLRWGYDNPTNPRVLNSTATLDAFLGGSPDAVPGTYEDASPLTHAGSGSPPTVLIHGDGDELVFPEHTRRMAQSLSAAGVKHMVVAMPWATHGCDYFVTGPCWQITTFVIERFLGAVVRVKTTARDTVTP